MRVLYAFIAAAILLAGLGFAAWRSEDATSVLESSSPPAIDVISPSGVTVSGLSTITIVISDVRRQAVSSPAAGIVTSIAPSGTLIQAGAVVATINDFPVVAFTGDAPLIGDIRYGMRGPSVERAIRFLRDLGFYEGNVDDYAGSGFRLAAEEYNADVGREADRDVLVASGLAWVGEDPIASFTPEVVVGMTVGQQSPLGSGSVIDASATVVEGPSIPQAALGKHLVGEVLGIRVEYDQGSGILERSIVLALAELGRPDLTAQLTLPEPFEALGVPAGAIVRDGETTCVIESVDNDQTARPVRVTVLLEEPGMAILDPRGVPDELVANPWDSPWPADCNE